MEKPELIAGLKQALERGYSLEQAMQSFKNAGYGSRDVEDSARSLRGVLSTIPLTVPLAEPQPPQAPKIPIKPSVQAVYSQQTKPQQLQQAQRSQAFGTLQPPQATAQPVQKTVYRQPKAPRRKTGLIISLIVILLILVGALVVTLFAKEQVVGWIETLLEKIGI